jgi:hypothetical protein
MRKLQAKPEYQRAVSYLLEKLRSVQDKGGLHAERMETQLRGTTTHTTIPTTIITTLLVVLSPFFIPQQLER